VAFVSNFQDFGSALAFLIMVFALVPTFILLRVMRIDERLGLAKEKGERGPGVLARASRYIVERVPRPSLGRPKAVESKAQAPPRRGRRWRVSGPLKYVVLLVMALVALFPVYWLVVTSLKTFDEVFPSSGVVFLPTALDPGNWGTALNQMSGYMVTSLVVTASVVLITLLLAVPTAYSISRFKTGGTSIVSWSIIVNSLPSVVFVIPLFYFVRGAHIYDTWFALISTYPIFTLPIAVWLLVGFVEEIPKQIDDAARIDGLGTLRILTRMIFPLMKPGLVAVVVLSIINSWHEFLLTLTLGLSVFSGEVPVGARGVTVYISNFLSATGINWATVSAGAVIVSTPLIVLVILLQKYYIAGLTSGAVKG